MLQYEGQLYHILDKYLKLFNPNFAKCNKFHSGISYDWDRVIMTDIENQGSQIPITYVWMILILILDNMKNRSCQKPIFPDDRHNYYYNLLTKEVCMFLKYFLLKSPKK